MVLKQREVEDQTRLMLQWRKGEAARLNKLHRYLRGTQPFVWLPAGVPDEVRNMAEISRVNVLKFVVDAAVQAMYVDGFRTKGESENVAAWDLWQRNRMDARQIGLHRAALAYGASYETVLPGDPVPVLRGVSPRAMTVVYGEDDDWPVWALEQRKSATTDGAKLFRLLDDEATYWVTVRDEGSTVEYVSTEIHGVGVCPVVRFRDTDDLDDVIVGQLEPLLPLQDQINLTTFSLLVAQHYGAHRQRYVVGWLAESESEAFTASAQKLWSFDDSDVKVGEFGQTELGGYIESREASLRHLATLSQTPVHELLGQLVNLSAEALVAARDSHNRKVQEHKTLFGEAHEQALSKGGELLGYETDHQAWVRWRDMDSRSLAQTADALGKLVQMLGVPPQELWERVPGVTQQEIESWRASAAAADGIGSLSALLDRQAGPAPGEDTDTLKKKFDALGVAIRSGVAPAAAAARVGLDGIEFSGAVPVSLRVTESQADRLED